MVSDRNRKIQDRAYEIWVEGGHQDGTSDHNWAQAEREIAAHDQPAAHPTGDSEPAPKSGGKAKTAKSETAGDAKPAKTKAPKDKDAKATTEKGKKTGKAKSKDAKPRSKT